ncbi:excisionase family DNA-binding protein [Deinococcus marmoris]|uniref:Excisionase n=1 Tax=Deinococcus marmoris TaxID=249408 RepID=A0A1U7NWP6_9DEIO|nr:helix-turn-helix domain-containing protein [Deinococcus marmoris]OLV17327.1 Excisionase [Deinococcus marmoris]
MTASFIATPQDQEQLQQMADGLAQVPTDAPVYLQLPGQADPLQVSPLLASVLRASVRELLDGHVISLVVADQDLSTIEAAKLLGMSRPFLVSRFLETGELPFHKVGSHRRIPLKAVLAFRDERAQRLAIADELTREAQEMGLYDL